MNDLKMNDVKRPLIRGQVISPATLISQVVNTAPFLFNRTSENIFEIPSAPNRGYLDILRENKKTPISDTDLWSYFDLALASHFSTVGTFVPTDVDLAIRTKLWTGIHHEAAFLPMWNRVQEFLSWDEAPVSKRFVITKLGKKLSGHQGEWFSIAMGAYGAALKAAKIYVPEVREAIEAEFQNQESALTELFQCFLDDPNVSTMKPLLSGIAAVAHNLGDLDRMFSILKIEDTDALKRRVFRACHLDARKTRPLFLWAGKIYKAILASENHRNFALREPKSLRRSSNFLLPFGPFLDQWGYSLMKSGQFSEGEKREIAQALILGWKKLNPLSIYTSQSYSRALSGMALAFGNQNLKVGREELVGLMPQVLKKELNEGGLRGLVAIPESDFEKKWLVRLKKELEHFSFISYPDPL